MKENQVKIEIVPAGLELVAYEGDNLYTVLLVNNVLREGEDAVRLEKGAVSAALDTEAEEQRFSRNEITDGWMLASQRRVTGDAVLFVPAERSPFDAPEPQPLPEEEKPQGLGLAVDLGSGLIVAGMAELAGIVIPSYSAFDNSQCRLLGDLGARIQYIRTQEDGLQQMQALLWGDIESLVRHLSDKTGLNPAHVSTMLVAGNTSLEQMLWGEMPGASLPEGAQWYDLKQKTAAQTPLDTLLPQAEIIMLPAIAADLGSDVVAGILASGLDQKVEQEGITLLLDLGLNSEIVAAGRGRMVAASVSTAPLEGVGLACGMRATAGAIVEVELEQDVWLRTIRDAKPRGICGAGLIAATYTLLQEGLLTEEGRILTPEEPTPLLAAHFRGVLGGVEFILSQRKEEEDIFLEQNDIRQLQMAKGSVYAACMAILAELGAGPEDIEQVLIAESYRTNLNPEAVRGLGFFPPVPLDKVKALGNIAWQGAYLCLGNRALLQHAQRVASLAERLDLAVNLVYAEEFLTAMNFTEVD